MTMTRRLVIGAGSSALLLSKAAFAEVNSQGSVYAVKDFLKSAELVSPTLSQERTGNNLSCGPTSLLFILNYYYYQKYGKISPSLSDVTKSRSILKNLYAATGQANNTITHLDVLKNLAKNKLKMSGTKRALTTNTRAENIANMLTALKENKPVVVALNDKYEDNPVGYFGHIVIIYGYQRQRDTEGRSVRDKNNNRKNDKIYYFDPYYGKQGVFKRSLIGTNGNNGILDLVQFAYLKVAP